MGTEECVLKVANMLPVHRDCITILKMLLNEGDAVRFCTLEPEGKVCNRFQSKKILQLT
ncbi:hypothetical protein HanPSC8_Chr01g0019181 [Helianthus annuus]|nr:hypothetical protein HanPSC8_Chr01g0019181 [Helianthus annuus]